MQRSLKIMLLFLMFVPQTDNRIYALETTPVELKFEPAHGFFKMEIQVSVTADASNSTIYYTENGNAPGMTVDQSTRLYQNPIAIDKTTVIRAIAIFADGSKSEIVTQTYLYIDDIIRQDDKATLSAGFPEAWGSLQPDYGMDPDIVNDPKYSAHMKEALLSIPSLSIAMNIDDLFGADGIYTNSEETGAEWERPGSAELIFPDQREGFQINCGIRIQGGWFRQDFGTKKHSFRLLFKSEYGATKLRYPLFGEDAADRFDTIVLRAGANDGYAWDGARYTEQYTRDEFGRLLHGFTGNVSPHGMFVHLYLNGIYWGLYNPVERPDDSFSAIYHGGDKSNWDTIDGGELTNGSKDAWNLLVSNCRSVASLEDYMEIQGKNPDGSRNPAFPILLDVQNYIDYMIVGMWGGNWDWPWKNYRIARDRTDASTGFQFYVWDYENTMGNNRDRSPLDMDRVVGLTAMGLGVGELHINLVKNENYRMLFADRVQKHFFSGGPFTPEFLIENYQKLASEIELAIIPESARWGDQHYRSDPLTQDDWITERDWMLNTYLPQRSDIVLDQFTKADLYPAVDAPIFRVNGAVQNGGNVTSADEISIHNTEGTVYYTFDGSDPRLSSNSAGNNFIIVPEDIQKYVQVPQASVSQIWRSAPGFDVSNWLICQGEPGGVGYERDSGYNDYITLDLGDEMYLKNATCYIRIPFNLDADVLGSLVSCTLRIRYDDGFIAYLNGSEVARKNFPENPQWNSSANSQNSDAAAVVFENIDISHYLSRLNEGVNLLAIQGLNITTTSSDFLISAELIGQKRNSNSAPSSVAPNAFEYSVPFALNQTTQIKARIFSNGLWSALNEAVFLIPVAQNTIIISELHYHPLPQDSIDGSEFEFIELENAGTETQSLSQAHFVEGVSYLFPIGTILRPKEYIVLASDEHYFILRYGFSPFGSYSGKLDNGGEQIVLLDALGDTLISFRYNDKQPWPESADGGGYSLVVTEGNSAGSPGSPDYWKASNSVNGSPGRDDEESMQAGNVTSMPECFVLEQNYPNPFNGFTTISYTLPQQAHVRLVVYNVYGRTVERFEPGNQPAGSFRLNWDGLDESGKNLASGLYLYTLEACTGKTCLRKSKKLLLIK
jgi:hypothetical protein